MQRPLRPMQTIPEDEPLEDDDESETSSVGEMQLSRDNYPCTYPTATTESSGDTESSAEPSGAMSNFDLWTAMAAEGGAGMPGSSCQPELDEKPGRIRILKRPGTLSQTRYTPQWEPTSNINFVWDHFGREFHPFDIPGLEYAFPQEQEEKDENRYKRFYSGIVDDVIELKKIGYNIEYPDGLLGSGFFGSVYRGYYGPDASGVVDSTGRLVGARVPTNLFAVKIVEFGDDDPSTIDKRERYETEKFIMTTAHHRNIVTIQMIINMGEQRSFAFQDDPRGNVRYLSPERVYLIMEFADIGPLEHYLDDHEVIETRIRVNLIRDLFAGLSYLHNEDIVHGDIHLANVLLYTEHSDIVAKWADFGLGYVGKNKQYRFQKRTKDDMQLKYWKDLEQTSRVMRAVLNDRLDWDYQSKPPEEANILREYIEMVKMIRTSDNLRVVYDRYKALLEDELDYQERHF